MDVIHSSEIRLGNFTSSNIFKLMSCGTRPLTTDELAARPKKGKGSSVTTTEDYETLGKPALQYIEECIEEQRLGRPLDKETNAKALLWGNLMEKFSFQLLPLTYQLMSTTTLVHPEIPQWVGTPDLKKHEERDSVADIKGPYSHMSFIKLIKPLYIGLSGYLAMKWIRENHPDGEKYYWQLVSNAILMELNLGTPIDFAELIVYMPYYSEIQAIQQMITNMEDLDEQKKYYGFYIASATELPWIPDGGYYKNLNTIRFEIPKRDKELLTKRVQMGVQNINELKRL